MDAVVVGTNIQLYEQSHDSTISCIKALCGQSNIIIGDCNDIDLMGNRVKLSHLNVNNYVNARGSSVDRDVLNGSASNSTLAFRSSKDLSSFFHGIKSYSMENIKSQELTASDIVKMNQAKLQDHVSKQSATNHSLANVTHSSVSMSQLLLKSKDKSLNAVYYDSNEDTALLDFIEQNLASLFGCTPESTQDMPRRASLIDTFPSYFVVPTLPQHLIDGEKLSLFRFDAIGVSNTLFAHSGVAAASVPTSQLPSAMPLLSALTSAKEEDRNQEQVDTRTNANANQTAVSSGNNNKPASSAGDDVVSSADINISFDQAMADSDVDSLVGDGDNHNDQDEAGQAGVKEGHVPLFRDGVHWVERDTCTNTPTKPHAVPLGGHSLSQQGLDGLDVDDLLQADDQFIQQPVSHVGRDGIGDALGGSMAKDSSWASTTPLPESEYEALRPRLALSFPFELDYFQRQAVMRLERRDCVFVAAHTSAGKTVVAEYAIALSRKHMTRTIYTSPIKALSNQKYRDFREKFSDVGLITGDVSINPDASCLIMTTEILRSMLYIGSDIIRDIEFVIFDEVHYVNDAERGVVWEEVIILLPDKINLIFLSATTPNTLEFSDWIGRTKRRKVYVVSTPKRPVPLQHFLLHDDNVYRLLTGESSAGAKDGGSKTNTISEALQAANQHLKDKSKPKVKSAENVAMAGQRQAEKVAMAAQFGGKNAAAKVSAGASKAGNAAASRHVDMSGGKAQWLSLLRMLRFGGREAGGGVSAVDFGVGLTDQVKTAAVRKEKSEMPKYERLPEHLKLTMSKEEYYGAEVRDEASEGSGGGLLPVVMFCFSKKKCEEIVDYYSGQDLTTAREKAEVRHLFGQVVRRLNPLDADLPQVLRIRDMLLRGFGVHHGGLLPLLKELVEMLFSVSVVKVLFATETFAMGVNMPARSVVFNGFRKHDGNSFRDLTPGEYIQMAGRAGRRGLDSVGTVIVAAWTDLPSEIGLKTLLTGSATKLTSQFRLTYGMIVNVIRLADLNIEDMIKRSFSEFHMQRALSSQDIASKVKRLRLACTTLETRKKDFRTSGMCVSDAEEYHSACSTCLRDVPRYLAMCCSQNADIKRLLCVGRLICTLRCDIADMPLFGVVVGDCAKDKDSKASLVMQESENKSSLQSARESLIQQASPLAAGSDRSSGKESDFYSTAVRVALYVPHPKHTPDGTIPVHDYTSVYRTSSDAVTVIEVTIKMSDILAVFSSSIKLSSPPPPPSGGVAKGGTSLMDEFTSKKVDPSSTKPVPVAQPTRIQSDIDAIGTICVLSLMSLSGDSVLQPLDATCDLKSKDMSLMDLHSAAHSAMRSLASHAWRAITSYSQGEVVQFSELFRMEHRLATLRRKASTLEHYASASSLALFPDFTKRVQVLRHLGYVEGQHSQTVTLKGRVACEMTTCDELLATEMLFQNVLEPLNPPEVAALLASLVFQEKNNEECQLTSRLETARDQCMQMQEYLARLQERAGVSSGEDGSGKEGKKMNFGLSAVVYEWARGLSFQKITEMTLTHEGSIVRCITRLDELCRDFRNAARVIGNPSLYRKMEAASQCIKRDVVFAASLYVA